ncbi:hypothetical protein [Stomatohabitans albus]|uniref:hypothetical protein n=1 Tax=Stomatohabitans albus TaxID=3110766 RepID=UPI00300D7A9A
MIEQILPSLTSAAERLGDLDEELFPEEIASIARTAPKRCCEFRTVRGCARRALSERGIESAPIVGGHRGAPVTSRSGRRYRSLQGLSRRCCGR